MIKSILYKTIYSAHVNYILRSINKLFKFILPFRIPPSGKLKFKLKSGEPIVFHTNQTDHVSFLLFWNGLYKYEYLDVFEDIIPLCKGFIDIGANGGIYSLVGAKKSPSTAIIAFDPSDAAFFFLNKNIESNDVGTVVDRFQMAVSDVEGTMTFYKVKNPKYPFLQHNLGGAASLIHKPENFESLAVNTVVLDSFLLQNYPQQPIDLVKIDAEGAEPHIIRGMKNTIAAFKPILICEVLFDDILNDLEKEVTSLRDYQLFFHIAEGLKAVNQLSEKNQYDDVRNCFYIPNEKIAWFKKWII